MALNAHQRDEVLHLRRNADLTNGENIPAQRQHVVDAVSLNLNPLAIDRDGSRGERPDVPDRHVRHVAEEEVIREPINPVLGGLDDVDHYFFQQTILLLYLSVLPSENRRLVILT